MRAARGMAALIVLGALTSVTAATTPAPNRSSAIHARALPPPAHPYPAKFPAGEGHLIAERACAICHSPMLVTQQAKDSTGWEKTLATMEKWGAPVSGADHDTLRVYLVSHFGPKRK